MRVCLDARKLWHTGIGTYIRGLLEGMTQLQNAPEWDFILKPGASPPPDLGLPVQHTLLSAAEGYSFSELFTIARLVRTSEADLFHIPHYVIPFGLSTPLIVTVHDLIHLKQPQYFSTLQRAYARWMLRRVGRQAKFILTVSEHSKQDLVQTLDLDPAKIIVTNSGVSRRYFAEIPPEQMTRFKRDFQLPEDYLLYVGNLRPHKNVSGLIETWNCLPDSIRPPLVILGAKIDDYIPLARRVQQLHREGEVYFIENLPEEVMPLLHRAATAYVQPSWYEGFGSPPLEAMACGRPTAVSNRASLPEVTGGAALVFDPQDSEGMTQALERLLTDTALREDLSHRGPLRARQFDWALIAERTRQVYHRVYVDE